MQPLQTGKMEKEQFYSIVADAKALNHETLDGLKQLISDYPWFTAGWLLYLKNLKIVEADEFQSVLKKVAVMVPSRKVLFRYLNDEIGQVFKVEQNKSVLAGYELEGEPELMSDNSLIDKFLSSGEPRIKNNKAKTDIGKGVDNKYFVERSVQEDDELVSETLASIYFQQQNYDKALEAYQKLSLKYPEKSVYFAGRIKEIELIKNNN